MVLAVYTPKGFVPHAASLRHTFVHCGRFVTAASRRSPGSVSVPMWPANLSVRLGVEALVSRYLTNKLIPYRPIPDRKSFASKVQRPQKIIEYYQEFLPAILESGAG